MSFPKYPAYKDSGVEWIGEIPVGWIISPLRYLAHCLDGKRIPLNKEERSYKKGDIPYWGANCIVDFVDEFLFNQELILLGEDGAPFFDKTKEVSFYINEPIWPNNHVHVLKVFENFSPKFLVYSLNCVEYSSYIEGSTRDKLTQNNMNRIVVPIPPLPEQQAIASFLDRECGKIDALIAEQERLIALLAEKRQAVISHAVTKGLNPNAPMKDSGIPWIGMVPEGWEIVRFSRLVAIAEGQVDPKKEPYLSMILIAPNHIESGTGRLLELTTAADQRAESGKYIYEAGAVIYSKIRPALAKVALAPLSGLCSADMYPLTSRGRLDQAYLAWLMLAPSFTAWAIMESDRVAMPKINREKLNELMLPVPPLLEQIIIAEYITNETIKFDELVATANSAITLLKERRAALISAAVTGKIDVRAQSKALAA